MTVLALCAAGRSRSIAAGLLQSVPVGLMSVPAPQTPCLRASRVRMRWRAFMCSAPMAYWSLALAPSPSFGRTRPGSDGLAAWRDCPSSTVCWIGRMASFWTGDRSCRSFCPDPAKPDHTGQPFSLLKFGTTKGRRNHIFPVDLGARLADHGVEAIFFTTSSAGRNCPCS